MASTAPSSARARAKPASPHNDQRCIWLGLCAVLCGFIPSGAAADELNLVAPPVAATLPPSVVVAPQGGAAINLGPGNVFCPEASSPGRWALLDTQKLQPPREGSTDNLATLRVAMPGACQLSGATVQAVAYAVWPKVDPNTLVVSVDAGRLDVQGQALQGSVLRWSALGRSGSDTCRDPVVGAAGVESCAFSLDRDLAADPAGFSLSFFPAQTPAAGDVALFDAQGHPQIPLSYTPAKVVITRLLKTDAALDVQAEVGRLTLAHPEAVGSLECVDAACELDGSQVVIRNEHGSDEYLDLRLRLRPHVVALAPQGEQSTTPVVQVPLQRCPVRLASAPPLHGVNGQLLVVRLAGRCHRDASLRFFVGGMPAPVVQTVVDAEATFSVLRAERFQDDDFVISVQRGAAVVGSVRARPASEHSAHFELSLGAAGPINFIPTNRPVTLRVPILPEGGQWVPLEVAGAYTVAKQAGGSYAISGMPNASGWVAMRLAYRDASLPPALRDLDLAQVRETVDRALSPANVPMTLRRHSQALVELLCNVRGHGPEALRSTEISRVPFAARDTCHLVLHRERLAAQDGEQSLRVVASVTTVDGALRPEAQIDQVIRLKPGLPPREVYIGGVVAPFDRVIVRVAVAADDRHYSVATDEGLGAPPLQWSLTMGTSHLRFYATTAFPTGLFRVADKGHSGIMGLNSGILFRFVGLTAEGTQTPIGLETGVMWMGIAGDQTQSRLGQAGLVAGLSIGVAIANVSRATQASISLHAWGEYEVSRAILHTGGSPWGFVFGPSISIGDVGLNF